MLAPTLSLMARSLREDWRSLRTHLMRWLFVGIIVWLLAEGQSSWAAVGAPGLRFFSAITYLNFFFITLAAPGYFATAITEEKEEQTLGLLRMAGAGPLSLVLGKSVPRLLGAMLLLSAQFPFTLLAITLGGVTGGQVLAAYCTLLAYLLFAGNLALFWSVVCRTSRWAGWMTVISLGAFLLVPALIYDLVQPGSPPFRLVEPFVEASAFFHIERIMTTGFADSPVSWQVVTNLAAAAVLLLLSWGTFDRFVRDAPESGPERGLLVRRGRRLPGAFGAGRAWSNALLWKDFHFLTGGLTMMLVKVVLYGGIWLLLIFVDRPGWSWDSNWDHESVGASMMVVAMLIAVIELALHASRIFREEIKWKTLSGLMMLPHSLAAIAYAKVAGCLIALLPAAGWFVLGAAIYPAGFFNGLENVLTEPGAWWFVSQCVLFIHLTAYLSLWIKWGALPLAFGILFTTNACCITTVLDGPEGEAGAVLLAMLSMVACLVLHPLIGQRLEALAAE